MVVARKIVISLLDLGITQNEISERAGLSQGTVSRIAGGGLKPSRKTTNKLMDAAASFAAELSAHRDRIIESINATVDAQVKELTCNR